MLRTIDELYERAQQRGSAGGSTRHQELGVSFENQNCSYDPHFWLLQSAVKIVSESIISLALDANCRSGFSWDITPF